VSVAGPWVLHAEPERYGDEERAVIEAVASVDYGSFDDADTFRVALARRAYDAVFVRVGLGVGAPELAACPTLRWVVTPTTGLDHLDLDLLGARGVTVVSLRGEGALLRTVHATAEHTWGLLLALVRHTCPAFSAVRAGRWERDRLLGTELHGRTLGVLGHGRLGRMVARYGLAFGMPVVAHDTDPAAFEDAPGVEPVDLDELLDRADVLTLHLPLDSTTVGYLSAERLARLRPGAWLVNTARGELVDEPALLAALADGRLAGAAVDVVADDSTWADTVPRDQALIAYARTHDNLLVTPHIGGYACDSVRSTRRFVADRFAEILAGA
jgi:D-3-phosphoglycerate dehydrogenase